MQWVGDNLPEDWLYFSGDDDIFPDFTVLLSNIDTITKESGKMGRFAESFPIHCAFHHSPLPRVHRAGKWVTSYSEYPRQHYPAICLGGFYGMTVKLAKAIYNSSRHYPYFRHDDVFITGFMRLAVCDSYLKDEFCFDNDKFCALSRISNSHFRHAPFPPHKYKKMWVKQEDEMRLNCAEIVKKHVNV